MNSLEIISRLEALNANVQIYRTNETYIERTERWGAMIELGSRDTKLTLRARGATFDEALQSVWSLAIPHLHSFQPLLP